MGTPFPSHRPLHGRLFVGLVALVFAITAGGWFSAGLAAQGQKKEEEEESTKSKKKPPKVDDDKPSKSRPKEEEEERPSRPRKVIKVDDDEPTPAKPRPKLQAPPPPEAQMSIVEALREAKNPELREFYTNLKLPHDNITVTSVGDQSRTYAIEPQASYYAGPQTSFRNGYLQALTYDKEWRPSGSTTKFTSALRIQPYEEIVLDDVEAFLKKDFDQVPPTSPRYLARADMLKAAETVLAAADRFHASAREKGDRRGDDWNPVGQRLHERLFEIQLKRLDTFAAAGDWDGASAYARALADAYRESKERAPIAKRLVGMIQDALKVNADEDHLREARQRLRVLEETLPGSEALRDVANGLRHQAQALLDEAKRLRKAGKHQEAAARMELAADIYPNLPDLAEEMASLDRDHPVLRVGVRELPLNMIPGQATTDADLRAVELLYEGLVKLRAEPGAGQRYEACLAGGAPRLIPLGREFRIARGATWSDGTPVTVGDVKETLRAMRNQNPNWNWPGYSPLWNKMIEDAEGGGDSFRLSLRLHQGYLDPLSLMTFKVMSQNVLRGGQGPDAPKVGSGPFQYKRTISTTARNRKTALFLASPGYASREGKLGLPRIREIHLIHFADPADDPAVELEKGNIDLVLDLSAVAAQGLRGKDAVEVSKPTASRRVYFLAVNHNLGLLKGNPMLRQALAQAIDRQAILDKNFRAEKGKLHHSLNGPFPAGSWPCDSEEHVKAELYDPNGAKALVRPAVEKAGGPIKLTLLYPAGDPAAKGAMEQLRDSVNKELRIDDKTFIELQLEEKEPYVVRDRVEKLHKYELAYYHYDHPSEAYWLAPLFDLAATDINGSNYLGYLDGDLQSLFAQAKNHRDFSLVQQAMRLVHRKLFLDMPLIPLWQLDTFIAYRKALKPTAVDPLLIFNDVEHWSLEKR